MYSLHDIETNTPCFICVKRYSQTRICLPSLCQIAKKNTSLALLFGESFFCITRQFLNVLRGIVKVVLEHFQANMFDGIFH